MNYYKYLYFFTSVLFSFLIAPFVLMFYLLSNNKSEFYVPGVFQKYLLQGNNSIETGKFGSGVSFPDAIFYSVIITLVFFIFTILIKKTK